MFWVGLLLYGFSFLFMAVVDHVTSSRRGYDCAFWSVLFSFLDIKARLVGDPAFTDNLLESFSLLAAGLINVFFIVYCFASRFWRKKRGVQVLGSLILLMIPFCWIVFHYERMYPREGHFVWILGMLLVVYSTFSKTGVTPKESLPHPSGV